MTEWMNILPLGAVGSSDKANRKCKHVSLVLRCE